MIRRLLTTAVALCVLVVGPVPAPSVVAVEAVSTISDLVVSATASTGRIDVAASYVADNTSHGTEVVVDGGLAQYMSPGGGEWVDDAHVSWEATQSLGATPGTHAVTVRVIDWATTTLPNGLRRSTKAILASRTVEVNVPSARMGAVTLTRPPGSEVRGGPGGPVPFLALVSPESGGACPQTTLEYQVVGSSQWKPAALAWQTAGAAGGCDLDLTALGIANDATYRLRTVGAGGAEATSESWDVDSTGDLYSPHGLVPALSPDLTGSGVGDILLVENSGRLKILELPTADGRFPNVEDWYPYVTPLGLGWEKFTLYGPGDWNGDGRNDVLAEDVYGNLLLYPGNGRSGLGSPSRVGWGWGPYRIVPTGDLNGDRRPDLLAIDNQGRLWLYPAAGGGRFAARAQVGNGWNGFDLYAAGDMSGDGRNDILSIDGAGRLWFYAGLGNGRFAMRRQVGHGWATVRMSSGADLTADGVNDLLGRDENDVLWVYPGRAGGTFAQRQLVGSGW
ncbi:MAG: VCBS repeat-containing protein [Actinomycetales bacterium]|nr:VCBS repeat-containing protein [Actinomycetales bacterium]